MVSKNELILELQSDIEPVDKLEILLVLAIYYKDFRGSQISNLIVDLLDDDSIDAEALSSALFACLDLSDDKNNLKNYLVDNGYVLYDLLDLGYRAVLSYISLEECISMVINTYNCVIKPSFDHDAIEYQVFLLYMFRVFSLLGYTENIGKYKHLLNLDILKGRIGDNPAFFYECFFTVGDYIVAPESIEWNLIALETLHKYCEGYDVKNEMISIYNIACTYSNIGKNETADDYLNQIISRESELVDVCPDIISMAYSKRAEVLPNLKDDCYEEVFQLIIKSHDYTEIIKEDDLFNMAYLNLCKVGSMFFLNYGDYKRSENFSNDLYRAYKEGFGTYEDYLIALNNLALSYIRQGMNDKARNSVLEAMDYIKDNGLHETEIAKILKNTHNVVVGDEKSNLIEEAKENIVNCNQITSLNFYTITTSIRIVIVSNVRNYKMTSQIKRVLSLIEEYSKYNEDNRIIALYLATSALYYAFINNKIETLKSLNRLLDVEEDAQYKVDFAQLYIGICPDLFERNLSMDDYRGILLRIVHGFPYKAWELLKLTDEMSILKGLSFLSEGYKFVLSEYYRKKIVLSDEEVVEILINCENVYADLLRIRKEIESTNPWYKDDYKEVNELHRTIINKEIGRFFNHEYDTEEIQRLKDERHIKELRLMEDNPYKYMGWVNITEITSHLPDNYLYIDYLVIPSVVNGDVYLKDEIYLRYALFKENGRLYIQILPFSKMLSIRYRFEIMERFIRNKYGRAKVFDLGRLFSLDKATLKWLYNSLLKDSIIAARKVGEIKTILISGDAELSSFPYDALIMENGKYLVEEYNVIMVNSLRNYYGDIDINEEDSKNALIIGNPSFTLDVGVMQDSNNEKYLVQIPLSKIEVQAVSDALGTYPLLREDAQKGVLEDTPCRILHIATHGDHLNADYANEMKEDGIYGNVTNPLLTSCIFMSGANDWIIKDAVNETYGDGIISAEELCTYNMPFLKMVVLSACFSGSGDINYAIGLLGMRTALMATGAKAIITCLWEVDDFASAVFMTRFYNNIKLMTVSEALREAKLYIKSVTIGELSVDGWFGEKKIRRLGLVAEDMKNLSKQSHDTMIFKEPFYWAGFTLLAQ